MIFNKNELIFGVLSSRMINLKDSIFGRLTVLGYKGIEKNQTKWYCECECGNIVSVALNSLRRNKTKSCGCITVERLKNRGPVDPLTRLMKKVRIENGHWIWQGSCNKEGYPLCWNGRKHESAHITFYLLVKGIYDRTFDLDHLCRIRKCVNPDCQEPVTHVENIRRGETGIVNRSKTHCPKGHEYTVENTILSKKKSGYISRVCRTCNRKSRSEWGKKNRKHITQIP